MKKALLTIAVLVCLTATAEARDCWRTYRHFREPAVRFHNPHLVWWYNRQAPVINITIINRTGRGFMDNFDLRIIPDYPTEATTYIDDFPWWIFRAIN